MLGASHDEAPSVQKDDLRDARNIATEVGRLREDNTRSDRRTHARGQHSYRAQRPANSMFTRCDRRPESIRSWATSGSRRAPRTRPWESAQPPRATRTPRRASSSLAVRGRGAFAGRCRAGRKRPRSSAGAVAEVIRPTRAAAGDNRYSRPLARRGLNATAIFPRNGGHGFWC